MTPLVTLFEGLRFVIVSFVHADFAVLAFGFGVSLTSSLCLCYCSTLAISKSISLNFLISIKMSSLVKGTSTSLLQVFWLYSVTLFVGLSSLSSTFTS